MVSNILCATNKSHDNNLPTTWAQVEAGVCNLTCVLPGWKVIERDIIGEVLPSCIHGPAFNIPKLRDSRPWLPNLAAARWGRKQPQLGIPWARLLLCSVSKTFIGICRTPQWQTCSIAEREAVCAAGWRLLIVPPNIDC